MNGTIRSGINLRALGLRFLPGTLGVVAMVAMVAFGWVQSGCKPRKGSVTMREFEASARVHDAITSSFKLRFPKPMAPFGEIPSCGHTGNIVATDDLTLALRSFPESELPQLEALVRPLMADLKVRAITFTYEAQAPRDRQPRATGTRMISGWRSIRYASDGSCKWKFDITDSEAYPEPTINGKPIEFRSKVRIPKAPKPTNQPESNAVSSTTVAPVRKSDPEEYHIRWRCREVVRLATPGGGAQPFAVELLPDEAWLRREPCANALRPDSGTGAGLEEIRAFFRDFDALGDLGRFEVDSLDPASLANATGIVMFDDLDQPRFRVYLIPASEAEASPRLAEWLGRLGAYAAKVPPAVPAPRTTAP